MTQLGTRWKKKVQQETQDKTKEIEDTIGHLKVFLDVEYGDEML